MAYKVEVSDSAERDVDEILTYIADTLKNPKAAADFADALEAKYKELETNPLMFSLSQNKRLARMGYRRFLVGSYVALYLLNEVKEEVTIARLFYGRRDYANYI